MKLLLDTNRYSDLDKGIPGVEDVVNRASEICLSFVTLAELHSGFRGGSKRAENEHHLSKFLSQPSVTVLWPDQATVSLVADLSLQLKRQGTPIPAHDIWIAALALQHGLTLYARDKHFDHLPQLTRV